MWNAPGLIMPDFSTFVWHYFRGWLPILFGHNLFPTVVVIEPSLDDDVHLFSSD